MCIRDSLPNVYAIQEQMQLLPLSAYVQGGEYTAPQGVYKEENDFVPVNKVCLLYTSAAA